TRLSIGGTVLLFSLLLHEYWGKQRNLKPLLDYAVKMGTLTNGQPEVPCQARKVAFLNDRINKTMNTTNQKSGLNRHSV
ncbi:MAG: hypothetical protein L3J79_11435, partial [Candidatus Marinimicrobia bacterium]|nr:hypothetical protein [Candidatus Neomarinimicrobiota bacterium]